MSETQGRAGIVREILALFAARGHVRYGEAISQEQHALQCAALARRDGAADALVAAALLHDLGHLLGAAEAGEAGGDDRHAALGAARLEAWFGPEVTRPVALHVMAKRSLCAVEPGYAAALSRASTVSLAAQGGPFTAEEARRFQGLPFAEDAVRLRRFDDGAKVTGLEAGVLLDHAPLLERLARA